MIKGYTRPQLLIRQVLARTTTSQPRQLAAFVIGPQYDLFRYTNAVEKAALKGTQFVDSSTAPAATQLVAYEGLNTLKHVVDQSFAKLYADKMEAQLLDLAQPDLTSQTDAPLHPYCARILDTAHPNKVRVTGRPAILTFAPDGACLAVTVVDGGSGYDPLNPPTLTVDVLYNVVSGGGDIITSDNHQTFATPDNFTFTIDATTGAITAVAASGNAGDSAGNIVDTIASSSLSLPTVGKNVGLKSVVNPTLYNPALISTLHGRPIKPGDVVYVSVENARVRRSVNAVERELVASHFGSNTTGQAATDELARSSTSLNARETSAVVTPGVTPGSAWTIGHSGTWKGLTQGAIYNGYYGDRYTITCTRGGDHSEAQFRVQSDSGAFSAVGVAGGSGSAFSLNDTSLGGLTVTLTPNGGGTATAAAGQVWTFTVLAAYKPLLMVPFVDTFVTASPAHIAISGTYTGPSDTTYVITVVSGASNGFGGAVLQIIDAAGVDRPQQITVQSGDFDSSTHNASYPLGSYGLTLTLHQPNGSTELGFLPQNGLRKGDAYAIDAVSAKATGPASILVLSAAAADTTGWFAPDVTSNLLDMEVRTTYTGLLPTKTLNAEGVAEIAWTAGTAADGGITVQSDLALQLTDRDEGAQWVPFKTSDKGRLFAHWRGLVPPLADEAVKQYSTEGDIITDRGAFDVDNPSSYGSIIALRGAQGKSIWSARVATADAAGFTAALKQAERIDGIYTIAPMSHDPAVLQVVKNHVDKVSTDGWKLWRRAYFPDINPGQYLLLNTDSDGSPSVTTITPLVVNGVAQNIQVKWQRVDPTLPGFLSEGVEAGDLLRTQYGEDAWGFPSYQEYVVAEVLDEDELILVSGPALPIADNGIKFELWKANSADAQVAYVGDVAEGWDDRRVVSVWCDYPYNFDSQGQIQPIDLMYLCAEIAGLRTAVYPQQGLTNTQVLSVHNAPRMFTRYTQEQLSLAASHGVFIVTQEVEDGDIFIRHQLTTDSSEGSLYYEDSVGANIDDISYSVKDLLQPYIGRRNATPQTVEEILTRMRDLLNRYKAPPAGFPVIGPALIDWTNLTVAIDDVFKDRINVSVDLIVPLPLNNIVVTLNASTVQATVSATASSSATAAQ